MYNVIVKPYLNVLVSFRCYKSVIIIELALCVLVSFRCYYWSTFVFKISNKVLVSFRCYVAHKPWASPNNVCFSFFSLLHPLCGHPPHLYKVLVSFRCYTYPVVRAQGKTRF